jgi:hypothetical protein
MEQLQRFGRCDSIDNTSTSLKPGNMSLSLFSMEQLQRFGRCDAQHEREVAQKSIYCFQG